MLNFSKFIEEKCEKSLQYGKDEHDKDDFDHVVFGRKVGIEELIGIMMFAIIVMDQVFDDIEEDLPED